MPQQTPKVGGRYKRLPDGTVVPRDQAPARKSFTPTPAPEPESTEAESTDDSPERGE